MEVLRHVQFQIKAMSRPFSGWFLVMRKDFDLSLEPLCYGLVVGAVLASQCDSTSITNHTIPEDCSVLF